MRKTNLAPILNYAAQIYTAILGIAVIPSYMRLLGGEALGLIGFFTLLQSAFTLLDNGLSNTLTRETARYHAGAVKPDVFKGFLRSAEILILILLIISCTLLLMHKDFLAANWLKTSEGKPAEIIACIQMMIVSAGFRILTGIYRGILLGSNEITTLSLLVGTFSTLKFAAVIPFLVYLGPSITLFFKYQLLVSILELTTFIIIVYHRSLKNIFSYRTYFDKVYLKATYTLSMSSAALALIWMACTQVDKFVISRVLSLKEFGIFTIAVQACGAIGLLSNPIITIAIAKFSPLADPSLMKELCGLYRRVTNYLLCIVAPTTALLVFFPDKILWLWLENSETVRVGARLIPYYALGSSFLVIRSLPWLLLFTLGKLKIHIIGQIIFVCILIPSYYISSELYGAIGPAFTWCFANLFYLLLWTPLEHRVVDRRLHCTWLTSNITLPMVLCLAISYSWKLCNIGNESKLTEFLSLSLLGSVGAIIVFLLDPGSRQSVKRQIKQPEIP